MRAPKGFRFKVYNDTIVSLSYDSDSVVRPIAKAMLVKLCHGSDEIGYVDLVETIDGAWETHSMLDEEHRGKGLGYALYAKAIDVVLRKNERIRSSHKPSDDAIRAWKSKRLNERFRIKQGDRRFFVEGRKA